MSLKRNLLANYAGQAYVAGIGVFILPLYVRHMGAEAYGLVGFFTVIQVWFQLLDMGLTPTVSRELSRLKAFNGGAEAVALMIRSTEWLFGLLGVGGALALVCYSEWIAAHWLNARNLGHDDLRFCVMCMGGAITTRGLIAFYRGGIAGLECMVTLNISSCIFATVRSLGALLVMVSWSASPVVFFTYQLVISLVEWLFMKRLFYGQFPMRVGAGFPGLKSLRMLLGMAASMTFLAGLWTVISQADKLILSWTLDLADYGFFIVSVTLAGGLTMLAAPFVQVLQPRFTILASQGAHEQLVGLYRTSTQMTTAVAFAIAGMMSTMGGPLLHAWTGSEQIASHGAVVLALYSLGNAVAALLALAFAMQFAYGKLRLHVVGNCVFALFWLPGIFWASQHDGAVGVGWVWLGGNVAYLLCWLPWVHLRIQKGLWWRWLAIDVAPVLVAESIVFALLAPLSAADFGRWGVLALCVIGVGVACMVGLMAGMRTRAILWHSFRSLLAVKYVR